MVGSSSLMRRLRAIEARRDRSGKQVSVATLTDGDLYRILNVRNPVTGGIRTDLTDDELAAIVVGCAV
ncbi:hypothetical protein ACLNGM_20270 [Aureimonas phyllosphaerae]|uniref:hypothetical protein n=1 Tax=Aureimonas phyllosphaerae TaxID=1166078 RepID=UPI003A5C762C